MSYAVWLGASYIGLDRQAAAVKPLAAFHFSSLFSLSFETFFFFTTVRGEDMFE